jgi:hypothetical protein
LRRLREKVATRDDDQRCSNCYILDADLGVRQYKTLNSSGGVWHVDQFKQGCASRWKRREKSPGTVCLVPPVELPLLPHITPKRNRKWAVLATFDQGLWRFGSKPAVPQMSALSPLNLRERT